MRLLPCVVLLAAACHPDIAPDEAAPEGPWSVAPSADLPDVRRDASPREPSPAGLEGHPPWLSSSTLALDRHEDRIVAVDDMDGDLVVSEL